jgi:hypothetical protein
MEMQGSRAVAGKRWHQQDAGLLSGWILGEWVLTLEEPVIAGGG